MKEVEAKILQQGHLDTVLTLGRSPKSGREKEAPVRNKIPPFAPSLESHLDIVVCYLNSRVFQ